MNSITLLFDHLVDNIHLKGTVSQNLGLGPSFGFMEKKKKV